MADWIYPTPAEFKVRFPSFAGVDDVLVQSALDESKMRVDQTWVNEANFRLGSMLYAAHVLTLDGHGTGAEAKEIYSGGYQVIKSGSLHLQRFNRTVVVKSPLTSTSYGRRFVELVGLNFPAVMVV